MKRIIYIQILLVLLALCGCEQQENTDTRFVMDTLVNITADCDKETIDAAFEECEKYEKLLSATIPSSDVSRLNCAEKAVEVSSHTRAVIERGLYYGEISGGAFDITVRPVSELWDFNKQIVPERNEIAEALQSVDYQNVDIVGNTVCLNGSRIDLGGIAKGYITDCVAQFLKNNGSVNGVVNSSSSIVVFGKEYTVRIKKPFSDNETAAVLRLKNKSVSTSGTYERCFEKDGTSYHHILDPKTGYGVQTDLCSATVICDSALDGDALSTVCILLGADAAKGLIEATPDTEAVFITNDGEMLYTNGIFEKNGELQLQ